jgi:hypothetical protein
MFSPHLIKVAACALLGLTILVTRAQAKEAESPQEAAARQAYAAWGQAGYPSDAATLAKLQEEAIHTDRPDLAEQLLTGGPVLRKMRSVPRESARVGLKPVRTFAEFPAKLQDEMFGSLTWEEGWLARRITADRLEVWTPRHGWLFDGRGRLIAEAKPPRGKGIGRQWYGAFLPDGQWVTTDLDEMDGNLYFFSATGERRRALKCEELAAPEEGAHLIGWARSDRDGRGWVVNVGSEGGWATVWVAPEGPPRVLSGLERWPLCYPRALGPRGTPWIMSVPDDAGQLELSRGEAGHGPGVGFPYYSVLPVDADDDSLSRMVPDGNEVFGFWPGARCVFIGAESTGRAGARGKESRKAITDVFSTRIPIIDKTWCFAPDGTLTGWLKGRRVGDAADGRAMLFRMTADSRVITMDPDLRVRSVWRMVWKEGATADAVALWEDLRIGLFIRNERLVLARW